MQAIRAYKDDQYTVTVLQLTQCDVKRMSGSVYGFAKQMPIAVIVSNTNGNNTYYFGGASMTDAQRCQAQRLIAKLTCDGSPR